VAATKVREAMADSPVILLHGARQCGKSTLAEAIADHAGVPVRTFDDVETYRFAIEDPKGFVAAIGPASRDGYTPAVLDEIQRVPEIFTTIKASVDRFRYPGRFLVTGSSNVLTLPKLSDSLAGRMEVIDLYPLSQGEIEGVRDGFVDAVFADKFAPDADYRDDRLIERTVRGGFPEPALRRSHSRLSTWFEGYVRTMIDRDVRDIANIEHSTNLHRMLALIAQRAGSPLNKQSISSDAGLPNSTADRYFELLASVFFIHRVYPWWTNASAKLVRSPKVYVQDSGLLCALLDANVATLEKNRQLFGLVLENFIAGELRKQVSWADRKVNLLFLRTARQQEVDFVLEDAAGRVVAIEARAAATIQAADLRGMRFLRELAGERFVRGFFLYTGTEPILVDRDVWALPVSALWRLGFQPHRDAGS